MWLQICTYTWLSQMRRCFLTRSKVLGFANWKFYQCHLFLLFRLLVGAPEADAGQRGVVRGGAVYKCRPDSPGQCDLIQFDKEGQWEFSLIWLSVQQFVGDIYLRMSYVRCAYVFSCARIFKQMSGNLKAQSSYLSLRFFSTNFINFDRKTRSAMDIPSNEFTWFCHKLYYKRNFIIKERSGHFI